jgi:hypothetical protein
MQFIRRAANEAPYDIKWIPQATAAIQKDALRLFPVLLLQDVPWRFKPADEFPGLRAWVETHRRMLTKVAKEMGPDTEELLEPAIYHWSRICKIADHRTKLTKWERDAINALDYESAMELIESFLAKREGNLSARIVTEESDSYGAAMASVVDSDTPFPAY